MRTADKKAWIHALYNAGLREIEVGSFVPAKVLPQMADTSELVEYASRLPGLAVAVLVPNLKGAEAAVLAGANKITIPFSCSETHSLKNVRRTHEQMIREIHAVGDYLQSLPKQTRPHFEGGLSTAFGCTLEGDVPESRVVDFAEILIKAGCDEVGLSDTTGYANPAQVRRLIRKVHERVGADKLTGIHLHNTRGLGLANAVTAIDEGLTTIDASQGGLGGCPFAPGASGNIVTEDLVFMLEAMGISTGIDYGRLMAARQLLSDALPGEPLYGMVPLAGLPKNFKSS
ncbi:hydroxymethylglutaryl-CoA lyase [Polaromonas sp. OV174]|nr:hydroxymethylglutaryl-CoA lyase [Polaromonas sp. OV174]